MLSTVRPDAGTLITYEQNLGPLGGISGIACQQGLTFLQVSELQQSDFCSLLNLLAARHVETDMVQQETQSDGLLRIQVAIAGHDWTQVADDIQNLLKNCQGAAHRLQSNLAKLSVVGCAVGTQADVVVRIRQLLQQLNIQIWGMLQTDTRFSVLMAPELVEAAAAKLHQVLFGSDN